MAEICFVSCARWRKSLPNRLASLAILSVLAAASCSRTPSQEGVFVDPAFATLIPSDTTLIMGTRVDLLAKTPVFPKLIQVKAIDHIVHQTHLRPEKDLWSLLFVSDGKHDVSLGRGKFADELMAPDLSTKTVQRFGYKGLTLFGDEQQALLFINSSTIAIGETPVLRSLVDQRSSITAPPSRLAGLLKQIPREAQFWGTYAGGPVDVPLEGNLSNLDRVLRMIQNGFFYANFDTIAHVNASVLANSPQDAQQLHDALQALLALAQINGQVSANANRVNARFDTAIDRFLK